MTHCTHVSFTVKWSKVAVSSRTFTRLHVVVVVLHKATWQHRSKCTPSKKKRELQKGKGGKMQEKAARCKTDVLYPDSTPLPTLNWDTDTARPSLVAPRGARGVTRWARWSCCISGCSSWESPSTAPARVQSGSCPASRIWAGPEPRRWPPWGGSAAGRFHLSRRVSSYWGLHFLFKSKWIIIPD